VTVVVEERGRRIKGEWLNDCHQVSLVSVDPRDMALGRWLKLSQPMELTVHFSDNLSASALSIDIPAAGPILYHVSTLKS